MTAEEWRPVRGMPDYLVSSAGRVASLKRSREPRLMRPRTTEAGYLRVTLTPNGRNLYCRVHCLMAEAFLGPRPAGAVVRHLDGDPTNNTLANLAYGTPLQNADDKRRHGTHNNTRKTHCKQGHPYDAENTRIEVLPSRPGPRRVCLTCTRAAGRAYMRARRQAAKQAEAA